MYLDELSGGTKQRVSIAMAIALSPPLVIADEPTSALDIVVQRVVAETLLEVKARMHTSMILIGHDKGLQAQWVDGIAIMIAWVPASWPERAASPAQAEPDLAQQALPAHPLVQAAGPGPGTPGRSGQATAPHVVTG
jgi:ABC-type microcin C transport system duplicated ATPase subunit YejF